VDIGQKGSSNGIKPLRPLIGVTLPDTQAHIPWLCLRLAVWLAGGQAICLRPHSTTYHEPVAGLILGGGTDLYPKLYRGEIKSAYDYDYPRDHMERVWLERAERRGLPLLGICRGAQLLNIVRGGTLYVDVRRLYAAADYPSGTLARVLYRKTIVVEDNSLLARILGCRICRVNSMHSQAVDRVGAGLVVTARDRNGVPQAIEDTRQAFWLGVQFHPEFLLHLPRQRRLFQALVRAAAEKAATTASAISAEGVRT
jgi:putative glutamine amidotransferase